MTARTRWIAPLVYCALLTSCNERTPEEVIPIVTTTAGPTQFTLSTGSAQNVVYYLERAAAHRTPVNLSVGNLPPGISASFNPASIPAPSLVSTLTVSIGPFAQPGTYSIQTQVSGANVKDTSITLTVTVMQPAITLSVDQPAATIEQAKSVSIPVSVSRSGGYTGTIGLSAVGLPDEVTATFNPASLQGNTTTSTLTLTASLDASISSTPITVRAAGSGVETRTAPVQLTITPTTTPAVQLVPITTVLEVRTGSTMQGSFEVQRYAGYQGALNYQLINGPAGVTTTFETSPTVPERVTVHVAASDAATIGTGILTIRASGAGIEPVDLQLGITVLAKPGFTMEMGSPIPITMMQGGGPIPVITGLTFRRIGGFTDAIHLTAEGFPQGVTTSPPMHGREIPSTAATIQTTSTTWLADANATPGLHTITVRATSTNNLSAETSFPILVRARGSYTLAATPVSSTIPRGESRDIAVTITRAGGFNGNIVFSTIGLPVGINVAFVPANTNGNETKLTVTVSALAAPGTYNMFVRGTAPGADDVDTPIAIIVQ